MLGKLAGLAAVCWVGYIIYKNRSLTLGMQEISNDLSTLKSKVASIASTTSGVSSAVSNTLSPNTAPPATAQQLNFVDQPNVVMELTGLPPGAIGNYNMACAATRASTKIYINTIDPMPNCRVWN